MTRIRIHPAQVRESGVAAVTCADDLRAQATLLNAISLPAMTSPMAARHQAALAAVAARLGDVARHYGAIGEELQVRAAAAELADAPGEGRGAAAGRELARAIVSTATIVAAGGATATATLRATAGGVVASTPGGLRVAIAARGAPEPAIAGARTQRGAPEPHEAAHERPVAAHAVRAHEEIRGLPSAAVALAATGAAAATAVSARSAGGLRAAAIDPATVPAGTHRAEHRSTVPTPAPAAQPDADETDHQAWACWMASSGASAGVPPTLPVMMALAGSGLRNLPPGDDGVGFFGLDTSAAYAPAGFGVGRDAQPSGDWWAAHPDAQLENVVRRLTDLGGGIRTAQLDDPEALSRWGAQAAPAIDPAQLADAHVAASELVANCGGSGAGAGAVSGGGGGHLQVAQGQLGVHEAGVNAGPQVDRYLASAGVSSGNPWCASFVAWSLHESGHELPGGGWASVSTWVQAAESGQHGMQIVDVASARPGDIVAYDWGGQADFGQDGHIGLLESSVADGRFTAVEGNADDAVTRMERSLGDGNVVFIRLAG